MNRLEVLSFLNSFFAGLQNKTVQETDVKPFLDLVSSLRRDLPLSIPILRDMAAFGTDKETTLLNGKIERRYRRLCRVQEELGRLDLKKAAPGVSPEDYVFSRIDFSRYRQIEEKHFETFFSEGLNDFDEIFYKKNFRLTKEEIKSVIEKCYEKNDGAYRLQKENPVILSIMRTLETSPESVPLFVPGEIENELKNLLDFIEGGKEQNRKTGRFLPGMEKLFPLLVCRLDNATITHTDGAVTKLFISPNGDLSGTFRPENKPWTLVLIPAELLRLS